ncbi:CBS domain-containing protein [Candidatus Acetothermia bacterium]|jgi:acetoin utilization protein AcuB|nr:CBS domain-containing protein [Candidatus Acetothermia bacterium]MCI2426480.1 CBS domain-containing protein [Candidatus Acetothermia bacterium]MCI2427005.1 CBS domain-containing protein [Candidatus Acetothermia bacterium]MCI2428447.1 CBS domain-containing protein [Candidatus Acetothermia bacterium]
MNVSHYMQRDVITVSVDTPINKAKAIMDENNFGLVFVIDKDTTFTGFISQGMFKEIKDWETPVEKLAMPTRFTISPTETIEKAAWIMHANRLVLLPVVEENRLVGIMTQLNVLAALANMAGIGLGSMRITLKIRPETDDLYRVLEVLNQFQGKVISLLRAGEANEEYERVIIRVQQIEDKEALQTKLEAILRESRASKSDKAEVKRIDNQVPEVCDAQ